MSSKIEKIRKNYYIDTGSLPGDARTNRDKTVSLCGHLPGVRTCPPGAHTCYRELHLARMIKNPIAICVEIPTFLEII